MEIKRRVELPRPDPRVLHFSPYGLAGGEVDPELSLEYVQRLVADCELHSGVPDDVRYQFEVVRLLHVYGHFAYEFFTIAVVHAQLLMEMALGVRFLQAYPDGVRLVHAKSGERALLSVSSYAYVVDDLAPR